MYELEISSRRRRIFAFLVDHTIMSFLAGITGLLALGKHWDIADANRMMSTMTPIMVILFIVYFMKDSIYGMSPGRYILGVAVRDKTEITRCPSAFRLALRNFPIVIWPIEFLVLALSKQKRRLGDLMGKTVVIRRSDIPTRNRVFAFIGVVLFLGTFALGGTSAMIKNTSAYENAVHHIQTSDKIKEMIGESTGFGYFPTGSIQVRNQYGKAYLKMTAKGTKGNVPIIIIMEKTPEINWSLKQMQIAE